MPRHGEVKRGLTAGRMRIPLAGEGRPLSAEEYYALETELGRNMVSFCESFPRLHRPFVFDEFAKVALRTFEVPPKGWQYLKRQVKQSGGVEDFQTAWRVMLDLLQWLTGYVKDEGSLTTVIETPHDWQMPPGGAEQDREQGPDVPELDTPITPPAERGLAQATEAEEVELAEDRLPPLPTDELTDPVERTQQVKRRMGERLKLNIHDAQTELDRLAGTNCGTIEANTRLADEVQSWTTEGIRLYFDGRAANIRVTGGVPTGYFQVRSADKEQATLYNEPEFPPLKAGVPKPFKSRRSTPSHS